MDDSRPSRQSTHW